MVWAVPAARFSMNEMSKLFARFKRELSGMTPREHLALLKSSGVDGKACAFLLGVTESRISALTNPETAAKDRQRKREWMRAYRRRKRMNIEAEKLLLQLVRIADALEGIQQSLSLLVVKNK